LTRIERHLKMDGRRSDEETLLANPHHYHPSMEICPSIKANFFEIFSRYRVYQMSAGKQQMMTAFWGMVINNYTETHLALLRQGYPDHLKQLVYTLEKGESGTPHVQAYLRLFRQQRISYVKKLFPGANFQALTSDEYILNAQAYAQKLDETAEGAASITNNQIPDPVTELLSVIRDVYSTYANDNTAVTWRMMHYRDMASYKTVIERLRVTDRPSLAKFYVSPIYNKVWSTFGQQLMFHVCEEQKRAETETHTHTHTQAEIISRRGGITNASASEDDEGEEECYSEGSGDEGEDGEPGFDDDGTEDDSEGGSSGSSGSE